MYGLSVVLLELFCTFPGFRFRSVVYTHCVCNPSFLSQLRRNFEFPIPGSSLLWPSSLKVFLTSLINLKSMQIQRCSASSHHCFNLFPRPSGDAATPPDMDGPELEERVASAGAAGAPSSSGTEEYDSHEAEAIIASLRERVSWLEDRLKEKVRSRALKLVLKEEGRERNGGGQITSTSFVSWGQDQADPSRVCISIDEPSSPK